MCELHELLIDYARAMGARNVCIEHGGGRGSPCRFRRHPHLTGEINGRSFEFPIKGRPHDASRGYRQTYFHKLEDYLREVGGLPMGKPANARSSAKRKPARRRRRSMRPVKVSSSIAPVERTPTRLDQDPWAVLQKLLMPELLAAFLPAAFPAAVSNQGECDEHE